MPFKRSQSGFVLVATLWVLAALTLLASYIATIAETNVEIAIQTRAQINQKLDRMGTRATLIYLISTNATDHRSIILKQEQQFSDMLSIDVPSDKADSDSELNLTGTIYMGPGETRFSLQDESGLVNVNSPQIPLFKKALRQSGIEEFDAAILIARLRDYIDSDHRQLLNGAEQFEYRQQSVPLPANGLLATPLELKKVLEFDELVTREQWRKLLPMLSARQAVGYNLNVMPAEVISTLLDISVEKSQELVSLRNEKRINNMQQVEDATGELVIFDEDTLLSSPSRFIRIKLWNPGSGQRFVTGVEFTPFVRRSPWRIDYQYTEVIHETDIINVDRETNTGEAQPVSLSLLQ